MSRGWGKGKSSSGNGDSHYFLKETCLNNKHMQLPVNWPEEKNRNLRAKDEGRTKIRVGYSIKKVPKAG
jgi:hypothetical protein